MTILTAAAADLWFLNTWVTVRVSGTDGQDGLSILEHRAPQGDSPPRHIHHTEDEIFPGDFERFVRVMARTADRLELPAIAGPPSAAAVHHLTATAAEYGIEIVGPPLH